MAHQIALAKITRATSGEAAFKSGEASVSGGSIEASVDVLSPVRSIYTYCVDSCMRPSYSGPE